MLFKKRMTNKLVPEDRLEFPFPLDGLEEIVDIERKKTLAFKRHVDNKVFAILKDPTKNYQYHGGSYLCPTILAEPVALDNERGLFMHYTEYRSILEEALVTGDYSKIREYQ